MHTFVAAVTYIIESTDVFSCYLMHAYLIVFNALSAPGACIPSLGCLLVCCHDMHMQQE